MTPLAYRVLVAGILVLILAMGARQSFGIFQTPITMDLDVGRQVFGLAIAIQNLVWGLAQPFAGALADRFGASRTVFAGGLLYALGLVLMAVSHDPLSMNLTLGVLVGLGLSGCTYGTILAAVGRVVPREKRAAAFALCSAAGSFGMFALVPGLQAAIVAFDWRIATTIMAIALSLVAFLALAMRPADRPGEAAAAPQPMGAAIREAGAHRGYWLLNFGYFVCGFHVAFIATHLPAYLADEAMPVWVRSLSLSLIGLFNIFGTFWLGMLGGRLGEKWVLSGIYFARAVVIALFVFLPLSPFTALAFSAGIGFLWLGTVPLTSGLVARIFGLQYLAMLVGFTFLFHQLGSFLGAYGGGLAFDLVGSYDWIWMIGIALGIFAGIVHLPINDRPLARVAEAKA